MIGAISECPASIVTGKGRRKMTWLRASVASAWAGSILAMLFDTGSEATSRIVSASRFSLAMARLCGLFRKSSEIFNLRANLPAASALPPLIAPPGPPWRRKSPSIEA